MTPPVSTIQEQKLHDLFYNQAYQRGIQSVYAKVNDNNNHNISRRQCENWLKRQEIYQINAPQMKTKHIKPILASRPFHILQVDLIDFSQKPSGLFKYILVVIDVFTKYVWVRKLTGSTASITTKAMTKILDGIRDKYKDPVKLIMNDDGGEFKANFSILLQSRGIKQITGIGGLPESQAVVERANRTLKTLLIRRVQQLKGSWGTQLNYIVKQYNHTVHSTIKDKPHNVLEKYTNEELFQLRDEVGDRKHKEQLKKNIAMPKSLHAPLIVGDSVRLKVRKGKLDKYYIKNWSSEVYKIKTIVKPKIQTIDLVRYRISDLQGNNIRPARLRQDLQKIVL